MHRQETAALNQAALAARMRELQLKQWWLADQIAVDKRTVNRWLTGKVRRISRDNLARLAALLQCREAELIYQDETDVRATQQEQSQAAKLLMDMKARALFAEREEYALHESLLKAVMHPNMSIHELAQVYGQLTITAARQNKPEQAKRYAELTVDYAMRCGDTDREFSARSNIIAAEAELGELAGARERLHDLCSFAESVGNLRGRAVAQVNLMHACRLLGEIQEAVRTANQCIAYFRANYESNPLLGAYMNCAALARDIGKYPLARELRERYSELDATDATPRTVITVKVFVAEVLSLEGRHKEALELLAQYEEQYLGLGRVQDGELTLPSSILRRAGELEKARKYLDQAAARMWHSPYDPPFLSAEQARLAAAAGEWRAARKLRLQANRQFSSVGMTRRCSDDPQHECAGTFRAPSREKLLG